MMTGARIDLEGLPKNPENSGSESLVVRATLLFFRPIQQAVWMHHDPDKSNWHHSGESVKCRRITVLMPECTTIMMQYANYDLSALALPGSVLNKFDDIIAGDIR